MSISSILDLIARADVDFPDNNSGSITAQDLRDFVKDVLETVSPAYGMVRAASVAQALTTTPQVLAPYSQNVSDTLDYFVNNLVTGKINRVLGSAPGSRMLIQASGSIGAPDGREITVRLFKNGAPTDFYQTVTSRGATNRVPFYIQGLDLMLSDTSYELRSSINTAANATFDNVLFLVQAQPVRAFV